MYPTNDAMKLDTCPTHYWLISDAFLTYGGWISVRWVCPLCQHKRIEEITYQDKDDAHKDGLDWIELKNIHQQELQDVWDYMKIPF